MRPPRAAAARARGGWRARRGRAPADGGPPPAARWLRQAPGGAPQAMRIELPQAHREAHAGGTRVHLQTY